MRAPPIVAAIAFKMLISNFLPSFVVRYVRTSFWCDRCRLRHVDALTIVNLHRRAGVVSYVLFCPRYPLDPGVPAQPWEIANRTIATVAIPPQPEEGEE